MNSKIRTPERVELYVNAEEIQFLANAVTDLIGKRFSSDPGFPLWRALTNHLQELSMKLLPGYRWQDRFKSGGCAMNTSFQYKGHTVSIAPFHLGHPNQWPPVGDAIYIDGKHRCAAPRRGAKAFARKLIDSGEVAP